MYWISTKDWHHNCWCFVLLEEEDIFIWNQVISMVSLYGKMNRGTKQPKSRPHWLSRCIILTANICSIYCFVLLFLWLFFLLFIYFWSWKDLREATKLEEKQEALSSSATCGSCVNSFKLRIRHLYFVFKFCFVFLLFS